MVFVGTWIDGKKFTFLAKKRIGVAMKMKRVDTKDGPLELYMPYHILIIKISIMLWVGTIFSLFFVF